MMKFLVNLLTIIYFLIAIVLTVCLLSYNEYRVTQIGDYSLLLSIDEEIEDISKKGDLILVKKELNKNINIGDRVFFYKRESNEIIISAAKIVQKEEAFGGGFNYLVEGDYRISDKYIVGKVDPSTKVPYLGTILSILESRLVFLFLIVFPTFIIFLYELYKIVIEVKYGAFEDME